VVQTKPPGAHQVEAGWIDCCLGGSDIVWMVRNGYSNIGVGLSPS
jgi:hypothetical protein